jgi:predicted RNase H-like HicB family nuclease
MTYTVILVREEDGRYSAYVPALKGCMTWGETIPEALHMAEEAIEGFIAVLSEQGKPIPTDSSVLNFDLEDAKEAFVFRLDLKEAEAIA